MIALARLGARLAVVGGVLRAVLIVVGNLLGASLILAAFAVPHAMTTGPQGLDKDQRTLALVVGVFLLVPVVVLLMAVGRLSAGVRDRRLAALRLLGLTRSGVRLVTGVENGALAAIGATCGVVIFVGVAPLVDRQIAAGPGWFAAPLRPGAPGIVASWLLVVSVSVVVSIAPTRATGRSLLARRRLGTPTRPTSLRLVPLGVGVGYLAWAVVHPNGPAFGPPELNVFAVLAACVVVGVGLPVAIPVIVRLCADVLVRSGRGPSATLAGRRMQVEPAAATRLVAGLTSGIMLVTGAAVVLVSLESTLQYRDGERALTTGPQWADVLVVSPDTATELATTPGVQRAVPYRAVRSACNSQFGSNQYADPKEPCLIGLVATCAQMEVLLHVSAPDCVDGKVLQIRGGTVNDANRAGPLDTAIEFYPADTARRGASRPHVTVTPTGRTTVVEPSDRYTDTADILIPPSTPGIDAVAGKPDHWVFQLDAGYAPRVALERRARQLGDPQVINEDITAVQDVNSYRLIIWTLVGIVLSVAFAELVVTAIDRAQERRTWTTAQLALGIPARILRRAQLIQTLLPMAVGLIAAIATGVLGGSAFLALDGQAGESTPWNEIIRIVGVCLLALAATAAATLPTLSQRINPRYLHQE